MATTRVERARMGRLRVTAGLRDHGGAEDDGLGVCGISAG